MKVFPSDITRGLFAHTRCVELLVSRVLYHFVRVLVKKILNRFLARATSRLAVITSANTFPIGPPASVSTATSMAGSMRRMKSLRTARCNSPHPAAERLARRVNADFRKPLTLLITQSLQVMKIDSFSIL